MSQPVRKIWCPKCHKRHRLPANAGGMTLRCRGCQFAFRVQDGLTRDPAAEVVSLGQDDVVAPTASREAPVNVSPSAVAPTQPEPVAVTKPQPEPDLEPIALDHDFDDILDVLDSPVSEPLAPPPRAHAKNQTPTASAPTAVAGQTVSTSVTPDPQTQTVQRQPVSRSQLRAHRNSRQFWMLMSLLFAFLLGTVSWFTVGLFMDSNLSVWERKMLYAMGIPARWLPAQEGGEILLPPNHVKLRGDHIELADRSDNFRDDFFELPPENNDGVRAEENIARDNGDGDRNRNQADNQLANRNANQNVNRNARPGNNRPAIATLQPQANPRANQNDIANNRPQMQPRQRLQPQVLQPPKAQPNVQPQIGGGMQLDAPSQLAIETPPDGLAAVNRNPARNVPANRNPPATRRRPNRNRGAANSRVVWNPPEISDEDLQVALSRGIDPKTIQTLSVTTGDQTNVALADGAVFSIAGNRLAVVDVESNEVLNSRKLDRNVAAICVAASDGISNRPATWVQYENGQLEKWELRNGELNRTASVPSDPVFKERQPIIASGPKIIATILEGQIVVAEVLEATGRLGSTIRVPVAGSVSAMRFSKDGSQLLAIANGTANLINVADGSVVSQNRIPGLPQNASPAISPDLSSLFVARDGSIDSIKLSDGVANGRYWSSVPIPLTGVVSGSENLMGLSAGSPSHAVIFSIVDMVSGSTPANVVNKGDDSSLLQGGGAADVDGLQIHELSRSPNFAGRILAVQALPGNQIAFLSDENGRRRVGIAKWGEQWSVTPLMLAAGMNINGFHMSDDLSKVTVFDSDIVQNWSIDDVQSGKATFVSEVVSHTQNISRVMLTNDGVHVVSGDIQGGVNVSNFQTGQRTGGVNGLTTSIVDIAAKSDEGFVVMDRRGVANGSSKTTRDKIAPFGTTVSGAVSLSETGQRIAFQSGSEVRVADVSSQKVIGTLNPKNRPQSIRFAQSQKYVLLRDNEGAAVWDWRKGQRVRVFRFTASSNGTRSNSTSESMAVAMDGATVMFVSGDKMDQISVFAMPGQ